jgi:divalent metal cation (Fe/Co/Zn/Cd) transporter
MLDAVDPALTTEVEEVLREVPGVEGLGDVRIRWIGHRLHAEAEVTVDQRRSQVEAHQIAERARHALLHEVPHLASAMIHADPCCHDGSDHHAEIAHHLAAAAILPAEANEARPPR